MCLLFVIPCSRLSFVAECDCSESLRLVTCVHDRAQQLLSTHLSSCCCHVGIVPVCRYEGIVQPWLKSNAKECYARSWVHGFFPRSVMKSLDILFYGSISVIEDRDTDFKFRRARMLKAPQKNAHTGWRWSHQTLMSIDQYAFLNPIIPLEYSIRTCR